MDNFKVFLQAMIDPNSIKSSDIANIQKAINKYHINLTTELNTASMLTEIEKVVPLLEAELSKIYKTDIKINTSSILKAIEQVNTEAQRTAIQVSKITESLNNGYFGTQIEKLKSQFKQYGLSVDEAEIKVKELRSTLSTMESSSGDKLVTSYQNFQSQIKGVKVELDQAKLSYDKFAQPASGEKITSLLLKIQNFLSKNTAITKEAKLQLETYLTRLGSGANISVKEINEMSTGFKELETRMRSIGKLGLTFKDQWTQAVDSFKTWLSASTAVMALISNVKNAVTELKTVDDILTEISKTSDRTKSQLKDLGRESFDRASKFGRTASDWLTGVQEMNRSGFYGKQGNDLADTSTLAQSAGDMTAEVANNWILATNAAYKYQAQAEKLNAVLDGTNEITNRNSVNMTDMANAMTTVGSNAANAEVKVNELSALIGTAVATTKKEGNEVGTAYKTIFVNLQNVASTKIVNTLKKAGTSMTEMVNGVEQLRSPIAILKDLAKTYNELDKKDPLRAEITRNIGGKHYANILGSTLDGWKQFDKMLQDYSEGSGSAMDEAKKSANNWTGSLNKLSNSWTKLVSNFADSDGIITAIKGTTQLVNIADNLTDGINSISKSVSNLGGHLGGEGSSFGGTVGLMTGLVQSLTGHGENVLRPLL